MKLDKKKMGIGLGMAILGLYIDMSRLFPSLTGIVGKVVTRFIAPYTGNATIAIGLLLNSDGTTLRSTVKPDEALQIRMLQVARQHNEATSVLTRRVRAMSPDAGIDEETSDYFFVSEKQ